MNELLTLLGQIVALGKINLVVSYVDQDGQSVSFTKNVDIGSLYTPLLKTFLGQSKFNKWYQEIQKIKAQYNVPTLTIPIDLSINFQDIVNDQISPSLNPPTINATSMYDTTLKKSVLNITLTPANNTPQNTVYEIQYSYKGDFSDQKTIYTMDTHVTIDVVPNVPIWIRQRAKHLNSVSGFSDSFYIAQTARDTVPPSPAIVVKNEPRYLGAHIELQPFTEDDFAYCYITFNLDDETYKFTSTNNILDIYVGKTFSNVQANIYVVDTSGNTSTQTPVTISSQTFSEQEQTIKQQIDNTEQQVNLLNSTTSIQATVQSVSGSVITLNNVDISQQQAGFIAVVVNDNYVYEYNITSVDNGTKTVTVDDLNPTVQVGDTIYLVAPVYGHSTATNALSTGIQSTVSTLFSTEITGTIDGANVYISGNTLTDNLIDPDFVKRGIDNTFIVIFEDAGGNKETVKIDVVSNHSITITSTPTITPVSYTIYAQPQFVATQLSQNYDSIISTVEKVTFTPLKTGAVTNISAATKQITQTGENFDTIPVNSIVKIFDNKYVWYYKVSAVSMDTITLGSDMLLDKFDTANQKYEIYDQGSIIQSQLAQTANEISTAVVNQENQTQSQIQQLSDEIQLRVVQIDEGTGQPAPTSLTVQNGKIIANSDKFEISGDQIVSGTIDQQKASITGGNTTLDGAGIHIKDGDLQLGYDSGTGQYHIVFNNDGSGYLAKGKIWWDTTGSFGINATNTGTIEIQADNFKLSDGTNLVSFSLENGKFIFDGNIEIRNGVIQFDALDNTTKQKFTDIESTLNQIEVKLDQLNGTILDDDTQNITIRQRIYQRGTEINTSDSNDTIATNQFTYHWYIVDTSGTKTEISEYADKPELILNRSMINDCAKIECEQDWK